MGVGDISTPVYGGSEPGMNDIYELCGTKWEDVSHFIVLCFMYDFIMFMVLFLCTIFNFLIE